MIRVPRKGKLPEVMIGKNSAAARELELNRAFLKMGLPEEMVFEVYNAPSVKDALAKLFGRKCAYCESFLLGNQPGDVEHYRPKSKVAVRDANGKTAFKPGYFWLAAEWTNLLPACADCNRPRQQEIVDSRRRVVGKANWFPVADEKQRATGPRRIAFEPRLLIDPCVDDPDKHLEYTEAGEIAARSVRGKPSAMGAATIETCGLSRVELMQRRAFHRRTVMSAIRHTLEALQQGRDPGLDLEDLLALLDPKREYVGFTRYLVRLHMRPYLQLLGL